MKTSNRDAVEVCQTKDSSQIRELMHPNVQGNEKQSLAEAVVLPGQTTDLHKHDVTEEIYFILDGKACVRVGDEYLNVKVGDTILIPPGTAHNIRNTSDRDLRFLCCCSPAYSHEDTILLDD